MDKRNLGGAEGALAVKGERPDNSGSQRLTPAGIRTWRRALGLTQAALATELGVAPNTLARWERSELPIGK
ncbi:MAG: helix-turn-helix domain-containing protein, partial [Chloroflexota bacterium]|nr:helix-turn-helix domain-containing protein [Chloroflexota bacterium]